MIKKEYRHIHFEFDEGTVVWWCYHNKTDERLGYIERNKKWSQYIICLEDRAFFSCGCLDDASHFLRQLNDQSEVNARNDK